MINAYPSIYAVGHKFIADLFSGPVVIQEKIDGSLFSFGVVNGALHCRSKGVQINLEDPGMFNSAVATAKRVFDAKALPEGYRFRCEYLAKPKHNTLAYARVPTGNLVLFDVDTGGENYVTPNSVNDWATILGIEPVPVLYDGNLDEPADVRNSFIQDQLNRESVLGGCRIEGVVIKNYNRFGADGKILIGKYVSPDFKEVHRHEWRKTNPTQSDIVQQIIADYKTSPRWCKAIQHLRERNQLVNAPEDIGNLIREIQDDIVREEMGAIMDRLWVYFWPQISRGIIAGFPEFYKARLLNREDNTANKEPNS